MTDIPKRVILSNVDSELKDKLIKYVSANYPHDTLESITNRLEYFDVTWKYEHYKKANGETFIGLEYDVPEELAFKLAMGFDK